MTAVERAKQVTMSELNSIIGVSIGNFKGTVSLVEDEGGVKTIM